MSASFSIDSVRCLLSNGVDLHTITRTVFDFLAENQCQQKEKIKFAAAQGLKIFTALQEESSFGVGVDKIF